MKINRPAIIVKKLALCFTIILAVLFFQNCAQTHFSDLTAQSLIVKSGNNGGGYWGKPDYYRFRPGFTCEQKESAVSKLHIEASTVTLTENQKMACGALTSTFDSSLIDSSNYQNEIVGYKEGIFEGRDAVPNSVPANLVEVWCRDGVDSNAIETISHYDRAAQQAVTRVYYSSLNTAKIIPDFSVARLVSFNQVTVQTQDGFKLDVFRDRPAPQVGLFLGHLSAIIEGQKINRDVTCRLGGSVDPRIWPVPEIVDSNPLRFKWAPDFSMFAYTSVTAPGQSQLYLSDPTGKNQSPVSSMGPDNLNFSDFEFLPSSKALTFWASSKTSNGLNLFQLPLSNNSVVPMVLDQLTESIQGGSNNRIIYSSKGDRVISKFNALGWQGSFLRSTSLVGGPTVEYNISPSSIWTDIVYSAYDFKISKPTDRLAFLYGGYYADLYIVDVDGNHRVKVTLPASNQDLFFYGINSNIEIPEPGNFVIVDAYTKSNSPGTPYFQYFAVSIDGSQVIPLPKNTSWKASSASGWQVVVADKYDNLTLFDLQTLKSVALPSSKVYFFSATKPILYSTQTLSDGSLKPIAFSLIDGSNQDLCSTAVGNKIRLDELDSNRLLISSFDVKSSQVNMFVKQGDQPCQRKNSFPIAAANVNLNVPSMIGMKVSPDGQKILLHIAGSSAGKVSFDNLYYVPLDGKPAIQVNAPVFANAMIWDAQFLSDSRSVVYSGQQIAPNWMSIFLWQIPN